MTTPRPEIAGYLQASWPEARVSSIAGDASTRRFFRIHTPDGRTRVLMDYVALAVETARVRASKPLNLETDRAEPCAAQLRRTGAEPARPA